MKGKSFKIENTDNNEFVQHLRTLVREGFGITPFLGSGCSSASGILMGQEFVDYLGYVVYLCVSRRQKLPEEQEPRWDISRQGWPDRPNQDQVTKARKWAQGVFKRLCGSEDGIHVTYDSEHRVQSFQVSGGTTPELFSRLLASPPVPPFLRSPELVDEGEAIRSIYESLEMQRRDQKFYFRSSKSPTSYAAICEKALKSLCDWRATLQFLSTLRSSHDPELLTMEEPDQSVIDSFNVHITRDKKPNLTHVMMAQLSMSARIRVALTTNFDRLLETAFDTFGRQLSVIPVGIRDPLPHPDLVHQNDCVVKLHGDCHETRADFTLDDEPSSEDKRRFFHYVRGRFPAFEQPTGFTEERFIPSQLLVIGYSGSDNRCNDLLKYVLDSDKAAKIYWICHSQRDLERLNQRFNEEDYGPERLIATVTERPDLLLYDFYQKLNLTLPSAGLTYQFPDRVLPAKDPLRKPGQRCSATEEGERLAQALTHTGHDAENRSRGPLVIVKGESGVLTAIHEAFNLLGSRGKQRIWLELEDFPTVPVVGAEIYTSLAERTGALPLSHMKPLPRDIWRRKSKSDANKDISLPLYPNITRVSAWDRFFREACDELGLSAHSWVIGFYGRNGPGGCSGWEENQYWGDDHYEELRDLLDGLSLAGFSLLYAPYEKTRQDRDKQRARVVMKAVSAELPKDGEEGYFDYNIEIDRSFEKLKKVDERLLKENAGANLPDSRNIPNGNFYREHDCKALAPEPQRFENIIKNIWQDLLDPGLCSKPPQTELTENRNPPVSWRRQVTALYAATLYRQSRHFSAFLNDAVFRCPSRFNLYNFDNDANRVEAVEKWLKILSQHGMFFMKPGGFAWAYRDPRLGFRHIIERLHVHPRVRRLGGVLEDVMGFRARGNFHIGEWYAKAHQVTRHPMPMMEALHHFYQAAIYAYCALEGPPIKKIAKKRGVNKMAAKKHLDIYRQRLFFQALIAIHHTLRTGTESLRYWSSYPAIEFICDNFTIQDDKNKLCGSARLTKVLKELIPKDLKKGRSAKHTVRRDEKAKLLRHGRILTQRIGRELTTVRAKLQDRDPIVYFDDLRPDGEAPTKLNAPLANVDSLSKDWIKEIFQPVADLVTCAASEIKKYPKVARPEMGESLWREVGNLEKSYFLNTPQALRDPRLIHQKVQHLVEWSFIFIRRAKRLARAGDPQQPDLSSKKCFLVASVLGSAALDFCRLLPVELETFINQEKAKALSLYGLAQGHLGRFDESHRRLSEARAVIRAMRTEDRHVPLGITELRRAEVLCLQACECGAILRAANAPGSDSPENWTLVFSIFQDAISEELIRRLPAIQGYGSQKSEPEEESENLEDIDFPEGKKSELRHILKRHGLKFEESGKSLLLHSLDNRTVEELLSNLSRIRQARVGDAWRCLEEARREFVGRTHSERWWGRLYALEMRVFGEAGAAITTCRGSRDKGPEIERYRMLLCRTRRDVAHYLGKIWKKGLGVAGDGDDDVYERFRTTLLYRFALSIAESGGLHSISKKDLAKAKANVRAFLLGESAKPGLQTYFKLKVPLPANKNLQDIFIRKFLAHIMTWMNP